MEGLFKDIRLALRMLVRQPAWSAVVVASLALGIGANSAIFSVVNGILLRPLPLVESPDQIVGLYVKRDDTAFPMGFSYPDLLDVRAGSDVFTDTTIYNQVYASLATDAASPELVYGYIVGGNYFSFLGVKAAQGRTLTADDDATPGAHPVAVLSHSLWQRRFGGDPAAVGRQIRLNGHAYTVVGVAPPRFIGTEVMFAPDIWVPMAMHRQVVPSRDEPFANRDQRGYRVLARLAPGVDLEAAKVQMQTLAQRLAQEYPDSNKGVKFDVVSQAEARLEAGLGNAVAVASTVLMVLVGLVLLIACANVANLLLSRAGARGREISVRLAMGADRRRLIRQLLTESVLLSLVGGLLGLVLASWLTSALAAFKSPTSIPLVLDFHLDARVLLFTFLIALAAGVVFGLAPALQGSRQDLTATLTRGEVGDVGGPRRSWLRSALVVTQVAVSLPLLISASLFLSSLRNASSLDLGFDPQKVLTLSFDLSLHGYSEEAGRQFYEQLIERVRALAGVRAAAFASIVPLDFYANGQVVATPGFELGEDEDYPSILFSAVQPGYFAAMDMPLLAGRGFTEQDRAETPRVAVVNQRLAERLWPGREPLGEQLLLGGADGEPCTVVGVVETGKYRMLFEPPLPYFWVPFAQAYHPRMTLVIRTAGAPASLVAPVREEVRALDENLPVFDVRSFDELIGGRALMPFKLVTLLAGGFGLLGLLLATIGLLGVQAYNVSRRGREIAVRAAMGARPPDVLRLVLRHGLTLTAVGLVCGLVIALLLTRVMSRVLLNVSPLDPVAFGVVPAVLIAAAVAASLIPAWRAIRIDPAEALRHE